VADNVLAFSLTRRSTHQPRPDENSDRQVEEAGAVFQELSSLSEKIPSFFGFSSFSWRKFHKESAMAQVTDLAVCQNTS
jgi:hypothetical protein